MNVNTKTAFIAFLLCASGCDDNTTRPPVPAVSEARPSQSFTREVQEDPADEAFETFKRDAFRRELRFREALTPGHLAKTTRIRQTEIRAGLWSPDDLYAIGGQLFDLSFSPADGLGTAEIKSFRRVHKGRTANIDAVRCSACHWRGGEAGAGDAADNVYFDGDGDRPDTALERNAPALVGAGALELAGRTLSADLKAQRDRLFEFTANAGYPVRDRLTSQGIDFGFLTVHPDGRVEMEELEGVDDDLTIKPFGRKGQFESIREMVEESLFTHHGLQTQWMVENWSRERLGDGPNSDPDNDGVEHEITEGQVTALTLYLALQPLPTIEPPADNRLMTKWGRGRIIFNTIGCADCHQPAITLNSTRYSLKDRQTHSFMEFDLKTEGAPPRINDGLLDGQNTLRLFSDLKRHRMGEQLADPRATNGLYADEFMTPPLWGLARSRPYLHDGRAPTIEDAILLHGGEAESSRDAFVGLTEDARGALRTFLTSLNRARRFTAR